jgi:hypothetical protein
VSRFISKRPSTSVSDTPATWRVAIIGAIIVFLLYRAVFGSSRA